GPSPGLCRFASTTHQLGEEAFMRGTEIGEGDVCDRTVFTIGPSNARAASLADPRKHDPGLLRFSLQGMPAFPIRPREREHISALIFSEGMKGGVAHGEDVGTDIASKRHLGKGDRNAAIGHVMDGGNAAAVDQLADKSAVAALDLEIHTRW